MSGNLIIFDGIDDIIIQKDFFYESDFIRTMSNKELIEAYEYTLAYHNLIKDRNTMYSDQVSWGETLLGDMVRDIIYFGNRNLELQASLI